MSQKSREKGERFLSHIEPIQQVLSAYCKRALYDESEASDALQSAVLNAYRDFDLYAEGTNFRAWMFRYVSYEVLNRNRAAARRGRAGLATDSFVDASNTVFDESSVDRLLDDPESVLDDCEEVVAQAVRALPDMERSIFLLRAIGDFKYREIAEILEVPVGTVMGLLSRGRERLRRNLAEYGKTHGLLPGTDGG